MVNQQYAIISNGAVINVVEYTSPPTADELAPFPSGSTAVLSNGAGPGWTYANGVFTAPASAAAPTLTPAQTAQNAYAAAIATGVQIVSASTPAISGTYGIADSNLLMISGENGYIGLKGTFSNGQTSRMWLDTSNTPHQFPSIAVWESWAEAVVQYVDSLQTALAVGLAGGAWVAPALPVNIP